MFKIERRTAAIIGLKIHPKKKGKEKSVDISMSFTGNAELVDKMVPVGDDKDNSASEFFFNEKGHLRVPTVNPIALNRTPEGLQVTIYDRKDPIVLAGATANHFTIEFLEGGTAKVCCKIHGIPDKGHVERLKDILGGAADIAIEAEQDDLFSEPPATKDEPQGDLLDNGGQPPAASSAPAAGKPKAKAKAKAKAPAKKKAGGTKH